MAAWQRFAILAILGAGIGSMEIGSLGVPAAVAAQFEQLEIDQSRYIVLAAPGGDLGYKLMIFEQIKDDQPCWSESGSNPSVVEPLLLTFDFTGICSRAIDSNGYSVRAAGQDLGLEYSLRIVQRDNQLVLIAASNRDRNAQIAIGDTRGLPSGFSRIVLYPGWRLTRRGFNGRQVGHLYLTHDQPIETLLASARRSAPAPVAAVPIAPTAPPVAVPVPPRPVTPARPPSGNPEAVIPVPTLPPAPAVVPAVVPVPATPPRTAPAIPRSPTAGAGVPPAPVPAPSGAGTLPPPPVTAPPSSSPPPSNIGGTASVPRSVVVPTEPIAAAPPPAPPPNSAAANATTAPAPRSSARAAAPPPAPVRVPSTSSANGALLRPRASRSGESTAATPPIPPANRPAAQTPPPEPVAAITVLDEVYQVIVLAETRELQNRVKELAPSAFLTTLNGQSVMQAGVFRDRQEADRLQQRLSQAGLPTAVIPVR